MASIREETLQQFKELLPGHRPPKVGLEALSVFTRQLSAMIDAGIPIPRALSFFAEGEPDGDLRDVIGAVSDKVMSGVRLSHALRSFPGIFSDVYVALVETGENSGQISGILQRLADLLEKHLKMQKRIVATLTYPVILLLVSMLCIAVFVLFILPMVEPMFKGMNIALPLPTRILLASRLLLLPTVLALLIGGFAMWAGRPAIRAYLRSNRDLRNSLAMIPMRMPLVGPVFRKVVTSRILYAMATMLEAGMTLVSAITKCAPVAGNSYIEERMMVAKKVIVDGESVAQAFHESGVFPETAVQLITVGEETSTLATMVQYVAAMYEEDADLALTDMANMLEPLLMGGMGLIVGFIVVSAMLPTLQLINHL